MILINLCSGNSYTTKCVAEGQREQNHKGLESKALHTLGVSKHTSFVKTFHFPLPFYLAMSIKMHF